MTTLTHLASTIPAADIDFEEQVARELEIPVLAGLQRQGDVLIIPTRGSKAMAERAHAVPPSGVPVVRGENGGNTHLLVTDGAALWLETTQTTADLGVLIIPRGTICWLIHPEHGGMGIGAGSYRIRRQREQADEIRLVTD